ncbi:MAG: tRNA uridine-5-carboxymethylaminomethyl(34) synthesis GTPase MnmE [Lachnospiraceae bacterium]|nr:tRNA uridine-5-carboxymethylaminomethyl(34) synthesis GTPase MnmE [Lachnospiraceae bacterium]
MKTDTIAAIATAMSDSGIGIIRVSGEDSISIVDKIYRNVKMKQILTTYKSHTIHYGFIVEENETVIDEVMISIMKAPRSYTMEDTVEINCHGGVFMMRKILDIVVKAGARIAEPGEFTKRAFLNGRIDLSKAEAVMDIIHAKNEFALQSSVKQLKGSVSDIIKEIRANILHEIAFIEAALDDPEHFDLESDGYGEALYKIVKKIGERIRTLIDSAENGRILSEGIQTVIVGKPNAGKSSLLNMLVGEERAIVTDIAGTTRDILEETISIDGILFRILDTAGIRSTEDIVEKIGVDRARNAVEEADLVLYVIDSSVPLDENDESIFHMIKGKNTIILLNKSDLFTVVTERDIRSFIGKIQEQSKNHTLEVNIECQNIYENRIIRTSMKERDGVALFLKTVKEMFFHGEIIYNDEVYITNARHKEALQNAYESLAQVRKSIEDHMPEDFYTIDLMNAYASLGMIIGEEVGDNLVNEIFSKFCMGK